MTAPSYLERERCEECGRREGLAPWATDEELDAWTNMLGRRAVALLGAHLAGTTAEERAAAADEIGFDATGSEDYAILMAIQVTLAEVRKARATEHPR